jgi:hypothetical protein
MRVAPHETDLRAAGRLAIHSISNQFDRDLDDEPFFFARRRADGTAFLGHAIKELGVCHLAGRGLLALRMAELHLGVDAPEEAFAVFSRFCRQTFDNEFGLNSWDRQPDGSIGFEMHNVREGLYGLWAIVSRGGDAWAVAALDRALDRLVAITGADGVWDEAAMTASGMQVSGVIVDNQARTIDPLLDIADLTGDPRALDLAERTSRVGLARLFTDDGRFAPMPQSGGHLHSLTSSLSGIARWAVRAGDRGMFEHCRRVLVTGVPEYFSSWGWGDEVMPAHEANEIDQGEVNQTGDVVRAACAVASAGHPDLFDLADRFLRGGILATQFSADDLRQLITAAPDGTDATRDIVDRIQGSFGFPHPASKLRKGEFPIETIDITSGAVHALAMAASTIVGGDGTAVNLLFDADRDGLRVSTRFAETGSIEITADTPRTVTVRVPAWIDPAAVSVEPPSSLGPAGENEIAVSVDATAVSLRFPLEERTTSEVVDGTRYDVVWRAGEPVSITPAVG